MTRCRIISVGPLVFVVAVALAMVCNLVPRARAMRWVELGDRELLRGRLDAAQSCYAEAVRAEPGSTMAESRRDRFALQNQRSENRNLLAASTALQVKPPHVDQVARSLVRLILSEQPNSIPARLLMARIERNHGHADAARRWCRYALEINPKYVFAHLLLAEIATDASDWTTAADEYRKSVGASYRMDASAWYGVARSLLQLRRIEEASRALENAISSDATMPEPHLVLGLLLEATDRARAATELHRYLNLAPQAASAATARAALQRLDARP